MILILVYLINKSPKLKFFGIRYLTMVQVSNAILLKMDSETSKSITCHDIRAALGNNNENFIEGFTIINVPLDSTFNGGTTIASSSNDINVLDVQVFYTANALDSLPHEVIVDKISFYIIQDDSGKIPQNLLRKTLDISITIRSQSNLRYRNESKKIHLENNTIFLMMT